MLLYVVALMILDMKKHSWDLNDKCLKCSIIRRKVPYVGNGYNVTFINRMVTEYSLDGINFSKERINCNG